MGGKNSLSLSSHLEPRPKRRRRRRRTGRLSCRLRRRHRQVRADVERHPLVELLEVLAPAGERVERQPDPPAGPLDAAAELALLLDREPQRALPEPRQEAPSPRSSSPGGSSAAAAAAAAAAVAVVPQGASRGEPLRGAGPVGVVGVEAEHGGEGRDERAEAVEVGQRRRRGEGSRGWLRVLVVLLLLFFPRSSSSSSSRGGFVLHGLCRHRERKRSEESGERGNIISGFGFLFRPRGGGKREHRDLFAPCSSAPSSCCCSPLFAVAGPERVVLFPAARLERARAAREAAQECR